MAGNPLIALGSLNLLRASWSWASNPGLNVTASYLGANGIRLALERESVVYIEALTGAVTSPQPYMPIRGTMHLLKTQALAGQYKATMETNALIGSAVVAADIFTEQGGLPPYQLINCSISSVGEMNFSGREDGWIVTIRGYYLTNAFLWN